MKCIDVCVFNVTKLDKVEEKEIFCRCKIGHLTVCCLLYKETSLPGKSQYFAAKYFCYFNVKKVHFLYPGESFSKLRESVCACVGNCVGIHK